MGKVKRVRQKYHASLKKDNDEELEAPMLVAGDEQVIPVIDKAETIASGSGNIFAGLQIKLKSVKSNPKDAADESDRMSLSSITSTQKAVTKKDRRKQRREEFLKKIDTIKSLERKEKERKKRESTAVVGDVQPLLDSLPSLEELLASSQNKKCETSNKKSKKQKQATKDMLSDIQMFVAVNRDQEYKKDPFGAAKKAVQNRVLYEDEINKNKP